MSSCRSAKGSWCKQWNKAPPPSPLLAQKLGRHPKKQGVFFPSKMRPPTPKSTQNSQSSSVKSSGKRPRTEPPMCFGAKCRPKGKAGQRQRHKVGRARSPHTPPKQGRQNRQHAQQAARARHAHVAALHAPLGNHNAGAPPPPPPPSLPRPPSLFLPAWPKERTQG